MIRYERKSFWGNWRGKERLKLKRKKLPEITSNFSYHCSELEKKIISDLSSNSTNNFLQNFPKLKPSFVGE